MNKLECLNTEDYFLVFRVGDSKAAESFVLHYEKMKNALTSISRNTCCNTCQEAKLVALKALEES